MSMPENCILFATADWDEKYWTNKQHLAKSLAELGVKVLYVESVGLRGVRVNSKRDWSRLWGRFKNGLRSLYNGAEERSPGIFVYSPLIIPGGSRYLIFNIFNKILLQFYLKKNLKILNFKNPMIWTYHPFMLKAIECLEVRKVIYHCVDKLTAIPGIDVNSFAMAERELMRRADVIFTTSHSLMQFCKQYNENTYYFSNVVDDVHFGQALNEGSIPEDLANIPEPRLCYHGVLTDFKVDFGLILALAKVKTEWSWVFIGEERVGQQSAYVKELRELSNVYFLGFKSYAELPCYLRGMQVGLLPSIVNDYTDGMFPMKYYEYIAAGIPVVSTKLDFLNDNSVEVEIGIGVNGFIEAIGRQLTHGRYTAHSVRKIIKNKTWKQRTSSMLDCL